METNTIKLAVIQGKTITETAELHGGKSGSVKVRAPKGGKFVLVDAQTAHAPENITIKRVGKNLHLALEGDELDVPSLIVEDFYGSEGQLLGLGEDGSYYEYVAADGEADHEAAMLPDGSDSAQVLGTDKLDVAAAAESTNNAFVPLLLGTSALLAALLIRGGHSDEPAPPRPTIEEVHVQTAASPARIASGDLTNDNAPAAMGNGSRAANLIEVSVDGQTVGQTVVDADGIWRFTFDPPLADGHHSVTVREQGPNGKWSEPSAAFDLVVDTIPPDAPVIETVMDNTDPVTGDVPNNGYTNDVRPVLSGTAEKNSIVTIYNGTEALGTAITDENGQWTFTVPSDLADRTHQFTATATDAAGNVSTPSDAYTVIVDTTVDAPVIAGWLDDVTGGLIGNIASGGLSNDNRPVISGTGEAGAVVTIYDNNTVIGSAIVQADGTWSLEVTVPLAEGSHTLTATQVDKAGNASTVSAGYEMTVDTMVDAPVITGWLDDVAGGLVGNIASGGLSNDNRPVISGTGEAGAVVSIYDNGTVIGTAIVRADGSWSFEVGTPLADGNHALTATQVDQAGNASPAASSYEMTVDTMVDAPVITGWLDDVAGGLVGNIASGGLSNDNRPVISGTGEAGAVVSIYDNGTVIGTAIVQADGSWSFEVGTPLADGNHALTATQVDQAGNASPAASSYEMTVDTTADAPVITGWLDDVTGGLIGNIASGGLSNDNRPVISGTGEAGAVVTIYDNNTIIGTAIVQADGTWSFEVTMPLSDGDHALTATQVDKAGNASTVSAGYEMTVDTTVDAPVITGWLDDVAGGLVGNIASGGLSNDNRPVISGTGEAGAVVSIYDNNTIIGTAIVRADGTWSFDVVTPLSEGNHTLTATQVDQAGNASTVSASYEMAVDTTVDAPVITGWLDDVAGGLVGNIASGGLSNDNRPVISGTGEAGAVVSIHDNGTVIGTAIVQADGTWSFDVVTPLAEGNHTLTATQVDQAGNTSAVSAGYEMTVDTVPPTAPVIVTVIDDTAPVTGDVPNNGYTNDVRPTLSGTAEKNSVVTIYDGVNALGTAIADAGGNWTFNVPADLEDSTHQFTATATDAAGNISDPSAGYAVIVDTVMPDAPVITSMVDGRGLHTGHVDSGGAMDDTSPEIKGTGNAGSVIHLYDQNGLLGSTIVASDGSWTFTPSAPGLASGAHQIYATATGPSGLTSDASTAYAMTIEPDLTTWGFDDGTLQGWTAHGEYAKDDGWTTVEPGYFYARTGGGSNWGGPVLSITVDVIAGETYTFSFTSWNPSGVGRSLADLSLVVDGVDVITGVRPVSGAPRVTSEGTFTATTTGTITVQFVNGESDFWGNDFAITDITMRGPDVGPGTHSVDSNAAAHDDVSATSDAQSIATTETDGNDAADETHAPGLPEDDKTTHTLSGQAVVEDSTDVSDGNRILNLSLGDVLEQGSPNLFVNDGRTQMMVKGNAGDVVQLSDLLPDGGDVGDWAQQSGTVTVDAVQYNIYYHSGLNAELLVQTGVQTTLDNH
ncbi:Ig-like domain-containing protein [Ralstonia sp. 24A2]|uniref:Ig-like domain-containing protein n=1 Tax=Ralstonia sp. 24A2 TaxID=3447364 RepID=UPI003F6972FA